MGKKVVHPFIEEAIEASHVDDVYSVNYQVGGDYESQTWLSDGFLQLCVQKNSIYWGNEFLTVPKGFTEADIKEGIQVLIHRIEAKEEAFIDYFADSSGAPDKASAMLELSQMGLLARARQKFVWTLGGTA